MMTPATGWLGVPSTVSVGEGASSVAHNSAGTGTSLMRGRTSGKMRGRSLLHARTTGEALGEAVSRTLSNAQSDGRADTFGTSSARGTSEAFESVYALLPTSFHSKENALYMGAQLLRSLKTGTAYVRYFDEGGARETFLAVPRVVEYFLTDDCFAALRDRVFAQSPSASSIETAREAVAARERALITKARGASTPAEPETPAGYRTKRKRAEKVRS